MAFIDYYKIMGVSSDVPQKDIRKAYLKRSKQFHPDLHPDDPKAKAKFQALQEANAVLSDPEKRKKYDKYGEKWEQADVYEQNRQASNGFYYDDRTGTDNFDFSQFTEGSGSFSSFFENLFGHASSHEEFGQHVNGSFANPNDYNANAEVAIDMYTALLGGDIILQTKGSKLRLKVKPMTQNGTKIRLRGRGYQKADGTYGDLIITYKVSLPKHLTNHQRDLLTQMRDAAERE